MDDLILLLDSGTDLVMEMDSEADLVLETDAPAVVPYEEYDGEYTVIPILNDDQVLETQHKVMRDDVTVRAIPIVTTTNPYGGQTVLIG